MILEVFVVMSSSWVFLRSSSAAKLHFEDSVLLTLCPKACPRRRGGPLAGPGAAPPPRRAVLLGNPRKLYDLPVAFLDGGHLAGRPCGRAGRRARRARRASGAAPGEPVTRARAAVRFPDRGGGQARDVRT